MVPEGPVAAAVPPVAPKVAEVLPLLYLHGLLYLHQLSSKDFVPALDRVPEATSAAW